MHVYMYIFGTHVHLCMHAHVQTATHTHTHTHVVLTDVSVLLDRHVLSRAFLRPFVVNVCIFVLMHFIVFYTTVLYVVDFQL